MKENVMKDALLKAKPFLQRFTVRAALAYLPEQVSIRPGWTALDRDNNVAMTIESVRVDINQDRIASPVEVFVVLKNEKGDLLPELTLSELVKKYTF
jgi:hypothetical protein